MTTRNELNEIATHLDSKDPNGDWRQILTTFLPVGVADTAQLQQATHLNRQQLDRRLARLRDANLGGQPPVSKVTKRVHRPFGRGQGRQPTVYRLTKTGAALLRFLGHKDAHAWGLNTPTTIAHALAVQQVRLTARDAGIPVVTEREIEDSHGQVLRPDNLVTLPDGTLALFEIEQRATANLARRIIKSIQHKYRFFQDLPNDRHISPKVRVLFALSKDNALERTYAIWESILTAVVEQQGGNLPFHLLAMPLDAFLAQPDWAEPPASPNWRDLFNPAALADFAPRVPATQDTSQASASEEHRPAPKHSTALSEPIRYSAHESRLVLRSMLNAFNGPDREHKENALQPDPAFFDLMQLIYLASHSPDEPLMVQVALPHESWYLLREYLRMHPKLHDALNFELSRGGLVWNATDIRHKMQRVANVFLRYHGYRSDGPLLVYADVADWNTRTTRQFYIGVEIHNPKLLLGDSEGPSPSRREVELAEQALRWVLWSLFANGKEIGLKRPPYW